MTIAAIEHELPAAKVQVVGIRPPGTDALITRDIDRSAIPIFARSGHRSGQPLWIGIGVEHAETAFAAFQMNPAESSNSYVA